MSLDTTLRYETNVRKPSLINALNRQQECIERDELMAARQKSVQIVEQINLKSDWDEAPSPVYQASQMKRIRNTMKTEIKLANTAFKKVRRASLRKLLEKENAMYDKELQEMGKTFYVQRT